MRLPPYLGRNVVIVVALVAAGFFAAYLRFLPYLSHEARYTDGRATYELAQIDQLRFAVWDQPEALPPSVNSDAAEGRAALSPDGTLLVFSVGEPGLNVDLWVADMVDGEPVDARPLDRLNSIGDDLAPAFSRDALLFASNRPGSRGYDVWRAGYADGVFDAPERLPGGFNTEHDELDPAPVPGAEAIVFASNRPRGLQRDLDLYLAAPTAATSARRETAQRDDWEVLPFDTVNTPFDEREPAFTRDALGMVFASNRDGGPGGYDLFHSVRSGGAWQEPERLKGLNTPADERGPSLTGEGFTLLYTVAGDIDGGELVRARSLELFRLPGRRVGWLDLTLLGLLLLLALLAWLGRKWEALDVLYKCLLVSLLAHLLLLWWFRDVFMDHEAPALDDGERTFQVRLAPSSSTMASARERAGRLEVAAARGVEPGAPDRQELMAPRVETEARPRTAALAPQRLAEARDTTALDARREPVAATERTEVADRQAVAVALPDVVIERRAGGAPQVPLDAQATRETPATASAQTPVEHPSSEVLAPATASIEVSKPRAGPLARPSADAGAPSLQMRTVGEPPLPQRREAAGAVTVVQPDAEIERHEGGAPQLGLQARPTGAAPTAMETPRVAGRAAVVLPPTAAARAVDTPGAAALPAIGPVVGVTPTAAEREPVETTRPERATAERPVDVAQPTTEILTSGPGDDDDGGGESAIDLSSLGRLPQAEESARGAQAPERRQAAAPVLGALFVAPRERGLDSAYAQATAPTALAAPFATGAERPLRGLPEVAVVNAPAPSAPTLAEGAVMPDAGQALAPAAFDVVPRRDPPGIATPGRHRPTRDDGADGAKPTFQPLVAAAPAVAEPKRAELVAEKWEHTQYRTRFGEAKVTALEEHGGSEETEIAVSTGLTYLASVQDPKGHWGDPYALDEKYGQMMVGKTGLALLAFLGAGHTPGSGSEYADVTERAVTALLVSQDEETGHFGKSASYSHAIATYALAECFALTGDGRLRDPLRRAVDWILRQQNLQEDARFKGGWGYYYPDGRIYDPWPRTSVTVWQVMALESARAGGLSVPDRAFADAHTFLTNAYDAEAGVMLYNHAPARINSSYSTLPGSTPAGLFALSLLGEDIGARNYEEAVAFVLHKAPAGYKEGDVKAFVNEARGNLYFWYYGTLSMFRLGGDAWVQWNRRLQHTLLPAQEPDGSWLPISVYAKHAGDTDEDRTYTTAMCVLTLEVYYRYFTPLLQVR